MKFCVSLLHGCHLACAGNYWFCMKKCTVVISFYDIPYINRVTQHHYIDLLISSSLTVEQFWRVSIKNFCKCIFYMNSENLMNILIFHIEACDALLEERLPRHHGHQQHCGGDEGTIWGKGEYAAAQGTLLHSRPIKVFVEVQYPSYWPTCVLGILPRNQKENDS